ncbi:MAG: peptidoglycan editing factor PgeF [Lachnospiraceae bacterium]|nr:peptidoglycan editing factor PgeF [Lachnospiraceae bacterium]
MVNTTLCYIRKNDEYLMLLRNKKANDLNEQKWIGVGGKFLDGETVEECLVREVFEETNLTLTGYKYIGLIKFISDTYEDEDMYLFEGLEFKGNLIEDCPEGTLKWVPIKDVLDLPTWEGDKYFLKPMIEGKTNLSMTVRYENDTLVEVIDNTDKVCVEKSDQITMPHGFSTRIGGVSEGIFASLNLGMNRGDIKERVTENWRRFLNSSDIFETAFVCGKQVHENNVHIATMKDARIAYGKGELIEADGYVTNEKNLPLAIFTADCVPVLLEDSIHGVIGAVHCGWRSTVADIEKNAIDKMCSLGAKPECIRAAIGPSIDRCCFEVGGEVIEAVINLIGKYNAVSLYEEKDNGKFMLDLRGVVKMRLIQLGILDSNVEYVGGCTMCNPDRYYSHRNTNGQRGSLASVIMLK